LKRYLIFIKKILFLFRDQYLIIFGKKKTKRNELKHLLPQVVRVSKAGIRICRSNIAIAKRRTNLIGEIVEGKIRKVKGGEIALQEQVEKSTVPIEPLGNIPFSKRACSNGRLLAVGHIDSTVSEPLDVDLIKDKVVGSGKGSHGKLPNWTTVKNGFILARSGSSEIVGVF